MKPSRKTACSTPEIGPTARERTFVAVRAMVPVTHSPPNRAEATFATPCATSSTFERCRRPLMLSATTADNNDSIPPRSAMANASGKTCSTRSTETTGSAGAGKPSGMPPNRVPIVSTGSPSTATASAAAATATSIPGAVGRSRLSTTTIAIVASAKARATGLTVPTASPSPASVWSTDPAAGLSTDMPNMSSSWLTKMMIAMPAVNPTTTGWGM